MKPEVDFEELAAFYADKAVVDKWRQRAGAWQKLADSCMIMIFAGTRPCENPACRKEKLAENRCFLCQIEIKYKELGGGIRRKDA